MLEVLRNNEAMRGYLWRAETQKNGSLHFHISTNIVIHHKILRDYWNSCLEPLGYIDAFEREHGHRNPNSTDIHSVYKVKNLGAYLAKYMAKKNEYRPVQGRQWFLSSSLSKIPPLREIFTGQFQSELEHYIDHFADKKMLLEHAYIAYAAFFTANLKAYPLLHKLRSEYIAEYAPLIN
jgi:hypothetical protein